MSRTYFKTPEGTIYSVSEAIIALGYTPDEHTVLATDDEIAAFKQRTEVEFSKEEKISKIKTLLDNKLITEEKFNEMVEALPEDPEGFMSVAMLEAQRKAEEKAAKEAIRAVKREAARKAKEDQELAKKHAAAQAEYNKRQEEIEAIKKERAAAERLAEIEARRLEEARINEEIESSRAMREKHAELSIMHGRDRARERRNG